MARWANVGDELDFQTYAPPVNSAVVAGEVLRLLRSSRDASLRWSPPPGSRPRPGSAFHGLAARLPASLAATGLRNYTAGAQAVAVDEARPAGLLESSARPSTSNPPELTKSSNSELPASGT